jgi:hypothetical protein
MKKIYVILALLSIIYAPRLSFSQDILVKSNLTEIAAKIHFNSKNLDYISFKLTTFGPPNPIIQDKEILDGIFTIRETISDISSTLSYESQLLLTIPHIKEKYKSIFCKLRREYLDLAIKTTKISLNLLQYYYDKETYKKVFILLDDDPIKIIQSSLELLNKSIEILKSIENKDGK